LAATFFAASGVFFSLALELDDEEREDTDGDRGFGSLDGLGETRREEGVRELLRWELRPASGVLEVLARESTASRGEEEEDAAFEPLLFFFAAISAFSDLLPGELLLGAWVDSLLGDRTLSLVFLEREEEEELLRGLGDLGGGVLAGDSSFFLVIRKNFLNSAASASERGSSSPCAADGLGGAAAAAGGTYGTGGYGMG
jgi:hypothetical protein